jgi:LPXTG-motif cell wall-anchored protein
MNTYLKTLAFVAVVGIAGAGFAVADQWDKKTTITIDEPVQLPTTTLQPGTYVIKLVETSAANRHTVQFFDKDEKHVVTTILAIPNERVRPTGKSVFAFWETPAGQPKALRAWFYPGDNFGQEFAYPKDEAARISARNSNVTVPINDEKTADVTTAAAAEPAPAPTAPAPAAAPASVATSEPAPVAAEPAPAPAPVEVAAAQQPPPAAVDTSSDAQRVTPTPAPTPAADTLPQTASNMPLFGLIGLLSLAAALALKVAYNRS